MVPDPAVELIPRIEMSWLSSSKLTPGVKRATSAKVFISSTSILAAVKALTLTGTLLSASSLRVAVTTISETLVVAVAAGEVASAAMAAPVGVSSSFAMPEE